MGKMRILWGAVLLAGLCCLTPSTGTAQGLILNGSGGMHRSMAGASTAQGQDALGALYWNPAAISGLKYSEVVIGGEAIIPDTHLGSTIPAGAFGPLGPPATLSGLTRSDSGVGLLSGIGLVYQPEDSPLTLGMGLITLAGGGVNYPGSPSNPILAPVGPFNRFVLGPQAASMTIVSVMPTASYQVTDRLAFGFGPMVDISVVSFDPAFFGPPDDSSGDGLFTFPTGSHSRPFWGGGFRAGATYRITDNLVGGFSYMSPQWFETWKFNARTEVGDPFTFKTQFSMPMVLSMGLAFTGIERLTVVTDVRYFDYRTTKLLGQPVPEGGANWDNIWAVAAGARYQLNDRASVQLGYLFNENPISPNLALFNTQLPAFIQHTISAGGYLQLNDSIGLSLAYIHGFKNSISGSVSQLLRTSTNMDTEYDSIAFGLHVKFGAPRCRRDCPPCGAEACAESCPTGAGAHPQLRN